MQATQALTMTGTATIQRAMTSRNDYGGVAESWATAATVVCRIAPARAEDRPLSGKTIEGAAWTVTLPAGTDVRVDDRVVVGSRTFEVVTLLGGRTIETARVVLCVER